MRKKYLHFSQIDIENGYDYLQIESADGKILKKITGEINPGYTEFFSEEALFYELSPIIRTKAVLGRQN